MVAMARPAPLTRGQISIFGYFYHWLIGGLLTEAADVTIELDEVKTVPGKKKVSGYSYPASNKNLLSGLDLLSILLGNVAPRESLLLTELGVVIEGKLGVHSQDLVVGGLGQGVDLELGSIALHEALVEVLDGTLGLLNALRGEAEVGSDSAGDLVSDTDVDINGGSEDSLGALLGDSLDIHTTLGGGDDDGATSSAVQEDSEVEFATSELALANVDGVTDATTGASLLGDELVTDHLASEHLGLGGTGVQIRQFARALSWGSPYTHE